MGTIYELEHGAGMRPTVICLHASGGSGGQWRVLANAMKHGFHVLTPDLYGHGAAPSWDGPRGDIVAADVARISGLAAEAGGTVHLVGHSYGGTIALRVALAHPERVTSVAIYEPVPMRVLFDYNAKHRAAAEIAEIARDIRRALNGASFEHAARRFIDYWSGAGSWARLAPDVQATIAQRMPVTDAHFASLIHDPVRLRDYANVRVPVLYLTGRETRASARRMEELMRYALPDVEAVRLDDMGHLGPITHAETVAQRIAQFVRTHAGPERIVDDRKAA
jgi:pimeloyl-ACP methyl ester carboxylesterase